MKVCVVGAGYVGLTTAACLAKMGHDVTGVDINEDKISSLKNGLVPLYEPGLEEIVKEATQQGLLHFSTNLGQTVKEAELIFICVGTPPDKTGAADLTSVKEVAKEIGKALNGYKIIINKSTVPVGSIRLIKKIIKENITDSYPFDVVSNPEFLREGQAIQDFLEPDRIVIGATSKKAADIVTKLYKPLKAPILVTDPESAEMIKYASNAFLATKISFINEIARICERVGANAKEVAKGMGYDKRIGPQFLEAGPGWGGSCFPKDSKALVKMAETEGYNFSLLKGAIKINLDQRKYIVSKVERLLGNLQGKKIGVLGLSFKPNTDDVRYSPAIDIIEEIKTKGANLSVYDPRSEENAQKILFGVEYAHSPYEVARESEALVILTEWDEFRKLDFLKIKSLLKKAVIIDARNCLEKESLKQMGFTYEGIGR